MPFATGPFWAIKALLTSATNIIFFMKLISRYTTPGGLTALTSTSGARTLTISDQAFAGGGLCNKGGKASGAGGEIARATISIWDLRATAAGRLTLSVAKEDASTVKTTLDSAPGVFTAGPQGTEKRREAEAFSASARAIAKPSATMSAKPS